MNEQRYKLELSETQLRIIKESLNFAYRMKLGQMEQLITVRNPEGVQESLTILRGRMKRLMFPELREMDSHGIYEEDTPPECKMAFNMVEVMEHQLWEDSRKDSDEEPPEVSGLRITIEKVE